MESRESLEGVKIRVSKLSFLLPDVSGKEPYPDKGLKRIEEFT